MHRLKELLELRGPLTGKEIQEQIPADFFDLWRYCNNCPDLILKTIGSRYLRLDKNVEGFARLSPSILREFCNYTVVGLADKPEALDARARQIHQEIIRISCKKQELAHSIISGIVDSRQDSALIREKVCFMIAGDVAYQMAHLEPRPESSTGEFVNGSDLDIIVVVRGLSESIIERLDTAIYEQKYFLMSNPGHKEEIDYVIKDLSKVQAQLDLWDFKSMVANKILEEGLFLYGSHDLFHEIKDLVKEKGIPEKLAALSEIAAQKRENARLELLTFSDSVLNADLRHLLFTTEEREEFY